MGNIKSFLVEFIMAFLLGIAGFFTMFYIKNMLGTGSLMNRASFAILTGLPLGSSLGIFITKMFLFRTGKFSVLCLFTSLVFGFLVIPLWAAIPDYICDLMGLGPRLAYFILFPLVPLFALIGYNAMEVLLRRRKESGRSAPKST